MKLKIKQEKGITMTALVITVIMILILTGVMVYNTQNSIEIKKLTDLYNDIELLRDKVSEYYSEYGKLPAKIKYTNTSGLSDVLSTKNDIGDFYIIDLEAMQGITLNYGEEYEKVKNDETNANKYTDIYIINENSHNIFYVQGVEIKENDVTNKYYTDYTYPDETKIDLRYVEGILIPDGYYYIGKTQDNGGSESIVISDTKGETVDLSKSNQYVWTKETSEIEKTPSNITLENNQKEYQFVKSVNTNKGYFKNTDGKVQYTIVDEEKWSDAYTKETEYEDVNGDKVTIPQGFKISMAPSMNTVAKGLVVKDSNENEWVWVEVPKTAFTTAKKENEYDKIKADLIEYAKDYREGSEGQGRYWTDEWYEGCGISSSAEYVKLYNKMLSSVYKNRGFWISRYEIGDSTATESNTTRTSSSGKTGKAVSKPNQIPYNFVTCGQAQELANGMSIDSNKTSSLLFGIQWDLTCKFLEKNSNLTKADLKSDSTNWGNYKNSSLTLYRGKYVISPLDSSNKWKTFSENTTNYVINSKTLNDKNYYQLLTTGASEETNKMNIYDLTGNEWEWTLEHSTSDTQMPGTIRGGSFYYEGTVDPVAVRGNNYSTGCYADFGFRSTLY